MRIHVLGTLAAAVGLALGPTLSRAAPLMIVGNDEKVLFDDNGKPVLSPPGKDSVLIVDLADPLNPIIVANLPLKNSVVGPPVNLDIDPTGSIALVADSVDVIKDGDSLKQVPDDKIHVIDLKASPPKLVATITGAKQPSGLSINPAGNLALTADNGGGGASDGSVDTVSVVDLAAKPPRIIDWVVVGDGPEGLAMSPKGNLAAAIMLAGSNNKNAYFYHRNGSVTMLGIDGNKVTKVSSIEVGGLPEAAVFTPDGRYLLVGNYLDQDFTILEVDGTRVTDTGQRFKVPGHPASTRMGPR